MPSGKGQTSSTKSESEMVSCLSEYFTCLTQSMSTFDWAYPRFAEVRDKWSASYNGEGTWLVKACDLDGSYAGTWAVPEGTCRMIGYEKKSLADFENIRPSDELAKTIASRQKAVGKPPPLPAFAMHRSTQFGEIPRDDYYQAMVQAIQVYIVNIPYQEAQEDGLIEAQELIRSYYALDWRITYTSSLWVVATVYYEDKIVASIDPQPNKITAYRMLRW
jgi:hypothetical protein